MHSNKTFSVIRKPTSAGLTRRPSKNITQPRQQTRGFMLLEVLISMLLFSVGMLGMINLHAQSIRFSVTAFERNRAALMANELVTTMWAAGTVTLKEDVLTAWKTRLKDEQVSGLKSGNVTITSLDVNADGTARTVRILITWTSVARGKDSANGRYLTEFVIPSAAVI